MREAPPTRSALSLQQASRQFERWRATRRRGERIPAALWQATVDVARRRGVSRTSQSLQLDY